MVQRGSFGCISDAKSSKTGKQFKEMPMGLTPGHLSSAISLQATKVVRPSGSTYAEHILLHTLARELQRAANSSLNEVHRHLQLCASMPDGPTAPSV